MPRAIRSRARFACPSLVWLKAGWSYFIGNPGVWIAISVIFIVMLFVLGLVPLLGWAVVLIGFPVMVAGMVLGCHAQAQGEPLRVDHLFAGSRCMPATWRWWACSTCSAA
jgi:hypothetical protein